MADGMPTWHQPVAKAECKLKFLNSLTRHKVSIIKVLMCVHVVARMSLYLAMDEE